jgi:hemerythrin-like domain-containing protein
MIRMIEKLARLNEYIGYIGFIGVTDEEIEKEEKTLYEKMKNYYNPNTLNKFRKVCQEVGEDRHINGAVIADIQLKQEIYNYFRY